MPKQNYNPFKDRALIRNVPRSQCTAFGKNHIRKALVKELNERGYPADEKDFFRLGVLYDYCETVGLDVVQFKTDHKEDLRCENKAIPGGIVCSSHGGATPSAMEYAKTRLAQLVDPAITRLGKIVQQGKHEASVVSACKDVLDRSGLKHIDKLQDSFGYDPAKLAELSDDELQVFMKIVRKLSASGEMIPMIPSETGNDQFEEQDVETPSE